MQPKKITQLPSGSNPNSTSVVPIVITDTTSQITLSNLRQTLVDSGSHVFTGSQTILGNLNVSGSLNIGSVNENLTLNIGGGGSTYTFDYNSGSIFYVSGSVGTNTYNITNVPTTPQKALTLTFVLQQGTTPYSASAYQFNGGSVSVKWQDAIIPSGSTNKTDVIGLTAFRSGSTWNILGDLTSFG